MTKNISEKLEELVEESYEKIKEIYSAPHAAKVNLMQTDGKLAINILNHYKTLRQAEGGKEQARAVIAKMICDSKEEAVDFFKDNLPEIIIPQKQLSTKNESKDKEEQEEDIEKTLKRADRAIKAGEENMKAKSR